MESKRNTHFSATQKVNVDDVLLGVIIAYNLSYEDPPQSVIISSALFVLSGEGISSPGDFI